MCLDTDHLFCDLSPPMSGFVVAVSGGSDSLSLLIAAHSHAERHWPDTNLVAVTVDHGLRKESADEARGVAQFCASRGIRHRTMNWQGAKPVSGLSAAAREARYALLAQAAEEAGVDCILTGHTLDDQAETVVMRAKRGAGGGLAGMARATLYDDRVWIVRPLLDQRRAHLRSFLSAKGVSWYDDPSNENAAYERVRIRESMQDREVEAASVTAKVAGENRRALSNAAARLLESRVSMPSPGLFRVERSLLAEDRSESIHALRLLLASVGGRAYLPAVERVAALHAAISTGRRRVSLSRVVIDARSEAVWMYREARGLPTLQAGQPTLWDGRWRIESPKGASDAEIRPGPGSVVIGDTSNREFPEGLARAALAAEPWIYRNGRPLGTAIETNSCNIGLSARRIVAPYSLFLPEFDLAAASVLSHLMGNPKLKSSPWKKHIAP